MPEHVYEGPDISECDDFTRGYIEYAYFTDTGDTDQPPADAELGDNVLAEVIEDCKEFQESHAELLQKAYETGYTEWQAGGDFWLTRNRHGAGFWDRGLGAVGRELTEMAHPYGETYCYLGDDGKMYIE